MLIRILFCYAIAGLALPFLLYAAARRLSRSRGKAIGIALWIAIDALLAYGTLVGNYNVGVSRYTYTDKLLPQPFDGYRIVQLSDWHLSGMSRAELRKANAIVDSTLALRPDLIVFTGDLQNTRPEEAEPFLNVLRRLKAKDGVVAILGNHDYPQYIIASDSLKADNLRRTAALEQASGWRLLRNDTACIDRGGKRLAIAALDDSYKPGMEPQPGNWDSTLTARGDITIMLTHKPQLWREQILPRGTAQLTLAGHIHAMQLQIGPWSPAVFLCREWGGMYSQGTRTLVVSRGLGGAIPLRLGVPCEICLIELKRR